jgi:hypothetical protein
MKTIMAVVMLHIRDMKERNVMDWKPRNVMNCE